MPLREQAIDHINQIKNEYNLQWMYDCDLLSVAGIYWYDSGGTRFLHCENDPFTMEEALEQCIDGGIIVPFVGPRQPPEADE